MARLVLFLLVAVATAGCAVNQSVTITRTANYDAQGNLIGYSVQESLSIPNYPRPLDDRLPDVKHFDTGTTADRDRGSWPPRGPRRR